MPVEPSSPTGGLSRPSSGSVTQEERRHLTVLFADLSGFTGLSSKLDPEEVREVANLCFEHLNKAIIGQGGTIHKYEGDLVMAVFGHPAAHEDDPERAIRASFAMFELLPEVNRSLAARLLKPTDLGLHVGINSGTVVVGEMGSSEKKEYTVMGDAVNLASRMKDLAKRGEIVVSEPVFRASRYLFEYEAREPVTVKGMEEPVRVFRPLREKAKPDSKRGIEGLYAPLVGRDLEIGQLKYRAEALSEGKGGGVFVLGQAGLGKSRLLEELKQWLVRERMPVVLLEGRCLTYTENVPYWPFLQILQTVYGITDQDSRERVRERLLERTREIFPKAWAEIVPYLGYLFSIRFQDALDEKVKYLDAKTLKTQIMASFRRLLAELARARPLLLVLEDYHWIDRESLELMEFLFEAPEPFPMLLVALSRVERGKEGQQVQERLRTKLGPDYQEIVLAPLNRSAGTRLIYSLLKIPGFSEEFKDRILSKAEGNPFYLEEIIHSLIDSGTLTFRDGNWLLTSDVEAFSIPDTVQAVIATRLDKLEKDVREVLQMAAVIGRNFPVKVLELLSRQASLMLTLYLADLEEHEYIGEQKRETGREYIFRHPLFQEVAYNSLLKKRRRELHRRAGEVIEELYPDRLEDFAELLAYQYSQGDDSGKALAWLRKAGQKSKDCYANDEALTYFRQAIAILEGEPGGREQELYALYQALGEVQLFRGDFEEAVTAYEGMARAGGEDRLIQSRTRTMIATVRQYQNRTDEALKFVDEAEALLEGDSPEGVLERARISIMRCWFYRTKGEMERAASEAGKGLSFLAAIPKDALPEALEKTAARARAEVLNHLGLVYWNTGDYDRALENFQKSADQGEAMGDKWRIASPINNMGNVYLRKGDNEKAIECYQRGTAMNEEIGNRPGQARSFLNLGIIYQVFGQYDRARELFHKGLVICEEVGDRLAAANAHLSLGSVHKAGGEYDRAREHLHKALSLHTEIGYHLGVGHTHLDLGRLLLELGEREEARGHLVLAEKIIGESGETFSLAETYIGLAELNLGTVRGAGSQDPRAYAEKALKLAGEIGSQPLVADSRLVLGKVLVSSGDFAGAESHFQEAVRTHETLKRKRDHADACLEYARMLKEAAAKGVVLATRPEDCLDVARKIYADLNLTHKVAECR